MQKLHSYLIFVVFIVSTKSFVVANQNYTSRIWINSCRIYDCEYGLQTCVQSGCLGKNNCKNCVNEYFSECTKCAAEIIDESEDFFGNGRLTIFCDPTNSLHKTACSFFCRTNYQFESMCRTINKIPVCDCMYNDITTGPSVTTTPSTTAISETPTLSLLENPFVKRTFSHNAFYSIFTITSLLRGDLVSVSWDYQSYYGYYEDIQTWNIRDGLKKNETRNYIDSRRAFTSIASLVLPNGNIVTASDQKISIWTDQLKLVKRINAHFDFIRQLALLSNGDLVSASDDSTIKIWNLSDSLEKLKITCPTYVSSLVALNNDYLVAGLYNGMIIVYDSADGKTIRSIFSSSYDVKCMILLPNGYLASCADNSIKIWNLNNGSLIKTLQGHTGEIRSLVILQNGDLASSSDKEIKIWNFASGLPKKTLSTAAVDMKSLINGDLAIANGKWVYIWQLF